MLRDFQVSDDASTLDVPVLQGLGREGDVIAGYVLGELLGVGGMGVVYAARQTALQRDVALKIPRPELVADPHVIQRFRTEALAAARVAHRNVVSVFDYGQVDGVPYLVMERIVGPRLGRLVVEHAPMSVTRAIDIVTQLLDGLEESHASGVVHADVKSDNVLVETLRGGVPSPRLIDFGIARFLDDSESEPPTADRFVSGTPEYLAPELVHGDPPTIASDLYAVGVILYELVAGVTPFAASTKAQVMRRRLRDEPPSLVACCPDREISPLFDAVVAKALARDVGRRYANANELLTALRAAAPAREILEPLAVAEDVVPFSTRARTVAFGSDAAERSRGNVSAAVERGDGDAIVVAYLDLVSVLVENHRLTTAIDELEEGIALFLASRDLTFRAPVWRLMLSLAALYDGNGDRRRAWITARSARDQAALAGSSIGCKRADQLRSRLVGSGTRARTTQNGRPQRPR